MSSKSFSARPNHNPLSRKRLNLGDDDDDGCDDHKNSNQIEGGSASFKVAKLAKKRVNPFKAVATPRINQSSPLPPGDGSPTPPPLLDLRAQSIPADAIKKQDSRSPGQGEEEEEEAEEEEDYLSMALPTQTTILPETYSQRRARLERESELKSRVPSKAELALIEKQRREEGLKRSLLEDTQSRGYKLMKAMGWKGEGGLGREAATAGPETDAQDTDEGSIKDGGDTAPRKQRRNHPILEPIALTMKDDRAGIGHASEEQRKYRQKLEKMGLDPTAPPPPPPPQSSTHPKEDAESYRERIRLEREEKRAEAQFYAAQNILEGFDRGEGVGGERNENQDDPHGKTSSTSSSKDNTALPRKIPLKNVPLLYRSLMRHREEKERNTKARHEFMESLSSVTHTYSKSAVLPGYEHDYNDKALFGQTIMAQDEYVDEEEEDEELEQFNQLTFVERLRLIVQELRENWLYCFWCKYRYGSRDEMDSSCPGFDEDLHG